jgi:hypothetical protein
MRSALFTVLVATALVATAAPSRAQESPTAVTMTPDGLHLLVNKQLADERWSISMNLASDHITVVDVAGEVFGSADETDASFVHCSVRPDSTGSLDVPSSIFRLTCKGSGGCAGRALDCARGSWQRITDDVSIPASFFLPPDGIDGDAAGTAGLRRTPSVGLVGRASALLRGAFGALLVPPAAVAQTTLASVTLSPNLLSHLVVRDFSGQRWSIAFHMVRDDSYAGGFKPSTVTGNVFGRTANPAFVYCIPRSGTAVSLEDPALQLQFVCLGTGACTGNARACAVDDWDPISDALPIAADFFLPDGGRGTPPTSDAALMVLGGAASVPALVSKQFQGGGAATCSEGESCIVDRIGLCENVRGRQTEVDGECRCYVADPSPYCVRTGTEKENGKPVARIPAACGDECSFDVGIPAEDGDTRGLLWKAHGVSLPLFADSPTCFCHANPPSRFRAVETCGGAGGGGCASDRCCVDDPRDGCDPLSGDAGCSGICIAASADAGASGCGGATLAAQFCGDGEVTGSEVCDPQSDPPATCASLGMGGGTLDCSTCVPSGCDGGGVAPTITSIDEVPDQIDAYGRQPVRGRFADADGDVTAAVLVHAEDDAFRIKYDLRPLGRPSGVFEVAVGCNGRTGDDATIDFDIFLRDDAGHESVRSMAVAATCVAPPVCGDGVKQTGEDCDPASTAAADACATGQACVNDCSCQPVASCRGRCCPEIEGFCGHSDLACRCDEGCRDRGDCCADAKAECGL